MSIEPIDHTDLAEGDLASLREAQFVSAAPAIYCDDDCRADHEERRARERRKGRA